MKCLFFSVFYILRVAVIPQGSDSEYVFKNPLSLRTHLRVVLLKKD